MSIHYDVKEHLIINNTAEQDYSLSVYSHRLARIGALMLEDNAGFTKLVAITDGEKREFSGDTMTKDFHDIMRAINNADSVEVIADYNYHSYGLSAISPDVCDFAVYLDREIKESGVETINGLFYSLYNNADCSDNAGVVVAFGEKNGTLYTGNIEGKTVDVLPDGRWYSPNTTVFYDDDVDETKDIGEIESICDEMIQFRCENTFDINEREFSFSLYDLVIENNDEFNMFVGLCIKLLKATGGDAHASELRFTNSDSDDGQIATVKINDDGTHEIVLYSAE